MICGVNQNICRFDSCQLINFNESNKLEYMQTNFSQKYATRFRKFELWTTHSGYNKYGKRKSPTAKKILRRWAKNLRRKAENIIAPICFE